MGGCIWNGSTTVSARKTADGREFFAYGGDFGDQTNDGNFVTDGLVSRPQSLTVRHGFLYSSTGSRRGSAVGENQTVGDEVANRWVDRQSRRHRRRTPGHRSLLADTVSIHSRCSRHQAVVGVEGFQYSLVHRDRCPWHVRTHTWK